MVMVTGLSYCVDNSQFKTCFEVATEANRQCGNTANTWKIILIWKLIDVQALVVRRLDNAIHWNPADSVVSFVNTDSLDRDLFGR